MKIIEEYLKGKHKDQSKCEDIIFKGNRFIAVIDGATSKDGRSFDGKSGGKMAAELVYNSLSSLEEQVQINKRFYQKRARTPIQITQ